MSDTPKTSVLYFMYLCVADVILSSILTNQDHDNWILIFWSVIKGCTIAGHAAWPRDPSLQSWQSYAPYTVMTVVLTVWTAMLVSSEMSGKVLLTFLGIDLSVILTSAVSLLTTPRVVSEGSHLLP